MRRGVAVLAMVLGLSLPVGLAISVPASANVEGTADTNLELAMSSISAGLFATCGVDATGAAWCWGAGVNGMLGNGSTFSHSTPVEVAGGHTFTAVTVGDRHVCGLDVDGGAWCWGDDLYGQLGDGTSGNSSSVPVAVAGDHTFIALAAGSTHTCGIDSAGAAWCWGHGEFGQLGNTGYGDALVPAEVIGGHTFTVVAAGWFHTCAIDTNGAAWCWGNDDSGEVGDGAAGSFDGIPEGVPKKVVGGHTFAGIVAGAFYTCGLEAGGRAWCWGDVNYAITSGGTPAVQDAPAAVAGGHSFAAIAGGADHVCAIDDDRAAWCWGNGSNGELGNDATSGLEATPVQVAGDHEFAAVAAGSKHTCGIAVNGEAWCWGNDQAGQLGDGATVLSHDTPVAVLGGHRFGPPHVVTVFASSGESPYGTAPGPVTARYDGWAPGDDADVLTTPATCSASATSASDVGSYQTNCDDAAAPGYTFEYIAGNWSVTKAHVSLTTKATTSLASLLTLRTTYTTKAVNTDAGVPAAGVPVVITIRGRTQCTTTTNATGVAACTTGPISINIGIPSVPYTATTTGGTNYLAASADGAIRLF
jgi:alpha-tubulin suppressor-like RCC1 family protein